MDDSWFFCWVLLGVIVGNRFDIWLKWSVNLRLLIKLITFNIGWNLWLQTKEIYLVPRNFKCTTVTLQCGCLSVHAGCIFFIILHFDFAKNNYQKKVDELWTQIIHFKQIFRALSLSFEHLCVFQKENQIPSNGSFHSGSFLSITFNIFYIIVKYCSSMEIFLPIRIFRYLNKISVCPSLP